MNILKKATLACVAALGCSAAVADDGAALSAAMTLHAVDYLQTLSIAKSCRTDGRFHETNPLLGECPSKAEVTRYFIGTGALLYAAHEVLPTEYQKYLSYVWLSVEIGAVSRNIQLGIRIKM